MLTNMRMTAEEANEESGSPTAGDNDAPQYPYGLEIQLDDDALKKLGLALPSVGYTFMITALATVTRVGSSQVQDGDKEESTSLQITDMQLDAPPADASAQAAKLYGA